MTKKEGTKTPHSHMHTLSIMHVSHEWLNAALTLTHIQVHAGLSHHVSAITSNTQQLHGSENGWRYSTQLDLLKLLTNERQLDGGLTTCIHDQMSQDETWDTESTDILPQVLEEN